MPKKKEKDKQIAFQAFGGQYRESELVAYPVCNSTDELWLSAQTSVFDN